MTDSTARLTMLYGNSDSIEGAVTGPEVKPPEAQSGVG